MKKIDLQNLPLAKEKDRKNGWTIEPKLLIQLTHFVNGRSSFDVCMEEVEEVLLGASQLELEGTNGNS